MNRRLDEELDESLKKLDQHIRTKAENHEQLRHRILSETQSPLSKTTSTKKIWLSVAAVFMLFLGTSPFYSTTMASLVAKIVPLEIRADDETTIDEVKAVIKDAGYEISSIGMLVKPYTVHVSLMENEDSLAKMKEVLTPKIEALLYERGVDDYKLEITQYENIEPPENDREFTKTMERVSSIIQEAFRHYGYSGVSYGISVGNIVEFDMPDHIEEAEEILKYVEEAIKKEKLDVKQVKLNFYNAKHRKLDSSASIIVSEIYESLAGKSIYKVNGISYKVEKGVINIWIKSKLPENPDEQMIKDIERAIREFMLSTEAKDSIQDNPYKIELLSKSKKVLLKVTNEDE